MSIGKNLFNGRLLQNEKAKAYRPKAAASNT
jgi:hypothetical protein